MRSSTAVIRRLDAGPEVLLRLAGDYPDRYPALFESAAEGPHSRRSVLAAFPSACLWLDAAGHLQARGRSMDLHGGFLDALDRWFQAERSTGGPSDSHPGLGWVLFLSYEIAGEIEPRLRLPTADVPCRAYALRTTAALVYDHDTHELFAVAEAGAESRLAQLTADVAQPSGRALGDASYVVEEEEPELFIGRVRRAQDYIRAGDVYQVNLSRQWRARSGVANECAHAAALYRRLRIANPAPFAALAQWNDMAVVSSSPERLVKCSGNTVETCPIAGTRPRAATAASDDRELAELIAHPKERAEHVMLVDLERNDLGRVCEAGSVRVEELMRLESYTHVHHIVSSVRGTLRPEVTPVGVLRAVFPGGTITGCPKFRCMQIIGELEGRGRGAYTGSLGYLTTSGDMDLNILIRTMTVTRASIDLRAGAGIVADSIAERELEETRAKARGLLAALA